MFNGDVFSLNLPVTTEYAMPVDDPIADGCSNNTNYFTDGIFRGTCCCGCDKAALAD